MSWAATALIILILLCPILTASREGLHSVLSQNKLNLPVHVLVVDGLALLKVDPATDLGSLRTRDVILGQPKWGVTLFCNFLN